MEWTVCLNKTLEYIENNLRGEIDVGAVAEHVYVSPFYLQKGFQIMTGYSIGEYIRNRRLYESANDLVGSDDKIIDIAFRYGYETPESFTKAFARFHGVTPREVRGDRRKIKRFPPLKIQIKIIGGNKMDYDYVVTPMFGFKVIGFEREFSYETAYAEIPKFWDEICAKYCTNIYAGNPPANACERAIMDNCIGEYGVCIAAAGGGKFRYLIAGKYTGGEVPEGMTLFEFPASEWAKFKCVGPMPESLQKLNTKIFREWLPGNTEYEIADGYNVEWYSCDKDKDQPDYESGIWLPVKRK